MHRVASEHRCAGIKTREHERSLSDEERVDFDWDAYLAQLKSDAAAAYPQQLRRIQLALYDIGSEGLAENAEWLILHRARPLEPVMAG